VTRALLVVDTNVVVAGLLTREPTAATARILDAMLAGELRFLLSEPLLAEYRTVLLRPNIAKSHGLVPREVDEILVRLATNAVISEPRAGASGPAGDLHLFELLATEPDALLVSGDAKLLRQAGARGRTPRSLLDLADRRGPDRPE
jgi:putative PIN family toxin of toxin-antitoxin system